jgi:hypothetical protein
MPLVHVQCLDVFLNNCHIFIDLTHPLSRAHCLAEPNFSAIALPSAHRSLLTLPRCQLQHVSPDAPLLLHQRLGEEGAMPTLTVPR